MRQNLGGIGFWLTCKEKADWGRAGVGSFMNGCGSVVAGEEVPPTAPEGLTARQLALERTKKSSNLAPTHPSCNKHARDERSQQPYSWEVAQWQLLPSA